MIDAEEALVELCNYLDDSCQGLTSLTPKAKEWWEDHKEGKNIKFKVGDLVNIDRDNSIIAIITAITWRNKHQVNYECSWFCNGKAECAVIEGWRLSAPPAPFSAPLRSV